MRKRVALKILKNRDRLRYKASQIRQAEKIARKFGIDPGQNSTEQKPEATESTEE